MTSTTETPAVQALYDNLTPIESSDQVVYIVNNTPGLRYLNAAVASTGGDAGGIRMPSVDLVRLFPGLNAVSKGYVDRIEADADRQRKRHKGGAILSMMLDGPDIEIVRSLDKTNVAKVADWLSRSSDIALVKSLRDHDKHGPAARRAFDAWHSKEAGEDVKRLRHPWAMATGSRKVA